MEHKEIDFKNETYHRVYFELYFNQYREAGIYFTFSDIRDFPLSNEIIKERINSKATHQRITLQNKDIETEMCQRFYLRRWAEKKEMFCNIEIDFIEREINFLNSFNDKIKTEYDNKFTPLLSYLKVAKEKKGFVKPFNKGKEYNSNYFNEDCFLLFNYLIEKYEKEGNVKYINIYKYLKKEIAHKHQDKYRFTIPIDNYKTLILKEHDVTITKFEVAKNAFEDLEVPKLKDLTKKFKESLQ